MALDLLKNATHAVALTGAGISTPSGIPDFRSPESGLWSSDELYETASLRAFRRHPETFYHLIRPLIRQVVDAQPNPAHLALAEMQQQGRLSAIITQNFDNLHTKAGSHTIVELHGHLRSATCIRCYRQATGDSVVRFLLEKEGVPICEYCGGVLKPDIILMGEQIPYSALQSAYDLLKKCDLLLIAGSSLVVDPAARLPDIARQRQVRIIIVNYQPTYADHFADIVMHDDVANVLPKLASNLRP